MQLLCWPASAMPRVPATSTHRLDLIERSLQPLRVVGALKAGEQPDACRMREKLALLDRTI